MIGFLEGRIAAKAPPQLTIEVGGVGYEIEAPMSTFSLVPYSARAFWTSSSLNRSVA